MNIPYTYLIGWSAYNKFYYGRRTAKKCNPSEFWVSYFTSSKYVKNFRKQFGEPDIIQIRKTFDNQNDCCKWECKVLKRLNVTKSEKWLNQSTGANWKWHPSGGDLNPFFGRKHSKETLIKAVNNRRKNGGGDYHHGKPSNFLRDDVIELNSKRMKSNNPMKNKEVAKKASDSRLKTIKTFDYWFKTYFSKIVGDELIEVILANEQNLSFDFLRELGLKRDFSNSILKKFKERNMSSSKEVSPCPQ